MKKLICFLLIILSLTVILSGCDSNVVYTITYYLDGGEAYNPTEYTVADSFTLNNPTKINYVFVGWTGSDIEGIAESVTVNSGSVGNREYYAIFAPEEYNVSFILQCTVSDELGSAQNVICLYDGNDSKENVLVTYGNKMSDLANADPQGQFVFSGWTFQKETGEVIFVDNETVFDYTSFGKQKDITLKVMCRGNWSPIV